MKPEDDWTAAQYADELVRMRAAVDALLIARACGTPAEIVETLALEAGVATEYHKEIR